MMGIVIVLCALAGLALSGILGVLGRVLRRHAAAGDVAPLIWPVVTVVALAIVGIGVACLMNVRSTPPSSDDFVRVMKAMFLFGAAPGAGLLAGSVVAMFR